MNRPRIDWQQARARVDASERALNASLSETPERIEAVYRERARRLAESAQTKSVRGLPVLVFGLAREKYAVALEDVTEVLPYTPCTPLPGAQGHLLGVINLRGEPRVVVDLSGALALQGAAQSESGFVLMLRGASPGVGWKVDHIEGLREVRSDQISVSPAGSCGKALVEATLPLLDVDRVLAASFSKGNSKE